MNSSTIAFALNVGSLSSLIKAHNHGYLHELFILTHGCARGKDSEFVG